MSAVHSMHCIPHKSGDCTVQWELFREEKSAAEGGDRDAYGDPMLSLPQIILLLFIILLIQMMMILLIQMMMIIIVI